MEAPRRAIWRGHQDLFTQRKARLRPEVKTAVMNQNKAINDNVGALEGLGRQGTESLGAFFT